MQRMSIVHVADQRLAQLGLNDIEHVHRAAEFGLPLLEFLLVLPFTLNLPCMYGTHNLGVIFNTLGSNVVAFLFLVCFFVFVLK